MRIPPRFLEHRCELQRRTEAGGTRAARYEAAQLDVGCIVVMREKAVVDMREGSATKGQAILASTRVLLQPEDYIAPGGLITIFPGTRMQRTVEVVSTAYGEHSVAPSSAQAWCV